LAAEKILLINEKLVDATIRAHGPPPSEVQQQKDWYQAILRDALKVAARTTLVPNSLGQSPGPVSVSSKHKYFLPDDSKAIIVQLLLRR
jgi:hypothetical protein